MNTVQWGRGRFVKHRCERVAGVLQLASLAKWRDADWPQGLAIPYDNSN
jgi:hypothetical protein